MGFSPVSPGSPADSFHPAPHSRNSSMSIDSELSLSLSATMVPYRKALLLPHHVRDHCHIYFDEELYGSALTLLTDLVSVGVSHLACDSAGVMAPLPYHIELVSCLLIHPRHTSQAPLNEHSQLAAKSIAFLRNVLTLLGPVNAQLNEAFRLHNNAGRGSWRKRSRNSGIGSREGSSGSDSDDRPERSKGVIANEGRVRECAKDFWHMVGWAFNCSVKYPNRWKYWKVWLGYLLDVLDADWLERERLDAEADDKKMIWNCLLVEYLAGMENSRLVKRVVRSVFADGSFESLKEFPEVFPNEIRELKRNGQKRKRNPKFGKNNDDEQDSIYSSEYTDQLSESADEGADVSEDDLWLGGTESIALRQRLLTMLSRLSNSLPDTFVDIHDLYPIFYDCILPMPLPAFAFFFAANDFTNLPLVVYISLCNGLFERLLVKEAPTPASINTPGCDEFTSRILELCFLPFPASNSTPETNAKASILMENMLKLIADRVIDDIQSLKIALHKGIKAREDKVKGEKRRSGGKQKGDEDSLVALQASGQRLRTLLTIVERKNCMSHG